MKELLPIIIPVFTLLLGFITSSILDVWRDRRLLTREREARIEDLKIKVGLRRTEFQRENLLKIQDKLADLGRMTSSCKYHFDINNADVEYGKVKLPEEINEGFRAAQTETAKLIVRIHDADLKKMVGDYKTFCTSVVLSKSALESGLELAKLMDLMKDINSKIGDIYGRLDSVEDSFLNL